MNMNIIIVPYTGSWLIEDNNTMSHITTIIITVMQKQARVYSLQSVITNTNKNLSGRLRYSRFVLDAMDKNYSHNKRDRTKKEMC